MVKVAASNLRAPLGMMVVLDIIVNQALRPISKVSMVRHNNKCSIRNRYATTMDRG